MSFMRTLVYKRTHNGDPDCRTGIFGNHDCMGKVRGWEYDAVIGVGGIGPQARDEDIAGKLTWVGIGPHVIDRRRMLIGFDRFLYYGPNGPLLKTKYKALAKRMYGNGVRVIIDGLTPAERIDADRILALAKRAAPSKGLRKSLAGSLDRRPASTCKGKNRK